MQLSRVDGTGKAISRSLNVSYTVNKFLTYVVNRYWRYARPNLILELMLFPNGREKETYEKSIERASERAGGVFTPVKSQI